jgi:hypothetical protein
MNSTRPEDFTSEAEYFAQFLYKPPTVPRPDRELTAEEQEQYRRMDQQAAYFYERIAYDPQDRRRMIGMYNIYGEVVPFGTPK